MSIVNVETNAEELSQKLSAIISNQMPYVMAKTLTALAFDVRDIESRGLDRYFEIRTAWTRKSLKVVRAEKNDYPNSEAIVGVRDKVLAKNITGGEREGSSAIPGFNTRSLLNPGLKTLGPRFFPGRLIQTGDKTEKGTRRKASSKFKSATKYGNAPFMFTSKRGSSAGEKVIAVRRSKKRLPIDILYVLTNKQPKLDKSWPFVENAQSIVNKNYAAKFTKNLTEALR